MGGSQIFGKAVVTGGKGFRGGLGGMKAAGHQQVRVALHDEDDI